VIGIPTAAARDPEAGPAPGIGFAIPSDTVTSIASQLISSGKVTETSPAS
jgi:putative serine protease PepD